MFAGRLAMPLPIFGFSVTLFENQSVVSEHLFSTYTKFSEKLIFLIP